VELGRGTAIWMQRYQDIIELTSTLEHFFGTLKKLKKNIYILAPDFVLCLLFNLVFIF